MTQDKLAVKKTHSVVMNNRSSLNISGILEVDSFDEFEILMITDYGTLTVQGDKLHISKLSVNEGNINIEGEIDSIIYSDMHTKARSGFFSRVFK